MLRLFFSGYFGFGNIGDDALLAAALRGFLERDPETRFFILCEHPAFLDVLPFVPRGALTPVPWRDATAKLEAIEQSDAVLFTGGLLHDLGELNADSLFFPGVGGMPLHVTSSMYAALTGRRSVFLSAGAGPLRSAAARELAARAVELASLTSVRDSASRDALAAAGADPARIRLTADLVFAYPPVVEPVEALLPRLGPTDRPRLGVALRSWNHSMAHAADPAFWEAQTAEALAAWSRESGGELVFLPMQTLPTRNAAGPEDDRRVAARILDRLRELVPASGAWDVRDALTPGQMRWAVAQCSAVLAMRYHAAAFAALNGTPVATLSYDPKVSALAGQLGLAHLDTPIEEVSAARLLSALRATGDSASALRAQLHTASETLHQSALGVFDWALEAIRSPVPQGLADPLLARSLRHASEALQSRAEHARRLSDEVQSLNGDLTSALAARARVETDYTTLHEWSQAQATHITVLIADVQEAQRAAEARRFRIPSFDLHALRARAHSALDAAQKLTPAIVRRSVRPAYLAVYRRLFPVGRREFAPAPKPALKPAPQLIAAPSAAPATPLVSVILPVWNQPELLAHGIRSILDQTYTHLELIVVDDGSTADLAPVVAAFQPDPRFRCVRRPHEGLPGALSAGFRMARGDFWTWTSADNLAHPNMLAEMVAFLLRRPDVDLAFANMDLIDDRGAALAHSQYRVHAQRPGATHELDLPRTVETLGLINDNFIGACFLYRADLARALGSYDDALLGTEDYDYWLRFQSAGRIAHIDTSECLYSYRVHDDSLSGRHAPEIGRNAENLIALHRERSARSRCVCDISASREFASFVPGWEALGCRVEIYEPRMARDITVRRESARVTFSLYVPDTAAADAPDWHLLTSPELARDLPAAGAQRWLWIGVDCPIPAGDLMLARKARDNRYPLWDVADFHPQPVVYAGPIDDTLDWEFLRAVARALPPRSLIVLSTDPARNQPPHEFLPGCDALIALGYKRPAEWTSYLSQAAVILAPFASAAPGFASDLSAAIHLSANAGKPLLAPLAAARAGYELAPHAVFTDTTGAAAALERARELEVDLAALDRYLETIQPAGRARRVLQVAQALIEAPAPRVERRAGPTILLETESFDRGGLERVVFEMARWFQEAGSAVSVAVTRSSGQMAAECAAHGISVELLNEDPERLRSLLDRVRPDILIPHYSTFGAEAAWRRGIPVLSVIHNSYIWATDELDAAIRAADVFVTRYAAVSESARDFFSRRFGVSPSRIGVIPNGVDLDRCRVALERPSSVTRASLGIAPEETVFLMVGSLIGTKAQLHGIEAFARVAARRPGLRLLLVGPPYDAAYAGRIRQRIDELELGARIQMLPETRAVFELYRIADAFFCSSLTEGWSLAMTEAMFCGLPVITTDVGGAREALAADPLASADDSGPVGILAPPAYADAIELNGANLWAYATARSPRNLDALAAALEEFCDHPEQWRARAAVGRRRVIARYSTLAIAARYRNEVQRLLAEHYGAVAWSGALAVAERV